jgi:hypothetical protein
VQHRFAPRQSESRGGLPNDEIACSLCFLAGDE